MNQHVQTNWTSKTPHTLKTNQSCNILFIFIETADGNEHETIIQYNAIIVVPGSGWGYMRRMRCWARGLWAGSRLCNSGRVLGERLRMNGRRWGREQRETAGLWGWRRKEEPGRWRWGGDGGEGRRGGLSPVSSYISACRTFLVHIQMSSHWLFQEVELLNIPLVLYYY